MNKMMKLIMIFVILLSTGCSSNETTVNIESPEDYQGKILEYEYLDRDNLFMLTLSDESKVLIDTEGNVKSLKTKLKSNYYRWSDKKLAHCNLLNYSGDDFNIYDIYGDVQSEVFLKSKEANSKDLNNIKILKCDNEDYIWCITQEDNDLIFRVCDENGKELMNFSSKENSFIKEKVTDNLTDEVEIPNIIYGGKSVFTFFYGNAECSVTDLDPVSVLFSVNINTQKIIDSNIIFSEGYGIGFDGYSNQVGIFDNNGNLIKDTKPSRIISNGVYYDSAEKAFYDATFNLNIDLKKYDDSFYDNNGDILKGPSTVAGANYCFIFQGNYCPISFNGNDANYFSIIDREGNLLFQPISENEIGENPFKYIKEIDSNYLLIDDMIFDLSSNNLKKLDNNIYQLINGSGFYYGPINEKIYYLEYGKLKYYDPHTDQSKTLGI